MASPPLPSSPLALHVILFPFMSKGHTIPLLNLTKLIHIHRPKATFTIFTTPANQPFISQTLSTLPTHLITIISLPFPVTEHIPPGVESTDQLPSMSLIPVFITATEHLQAPVETVLDELLNRLKAMPTTFIMVSDGFLHWTQQSASKFGIPRLESLWMNCYVMTICRIVGENKVVSGLEPKDELIPVPDFPWVRVTIDDLESPLNKPEAKGPAFEFVMKCIIAASKSYGILFNTFYELESKFFDYSNSRFDPEGWPIGPLCLVEKPKIERSEKSSTLIEWLDQKQAQNKPVLYIAFGTQADISNEQLKEITIGLEKSGVDFLWALRIKPNQEEVMEGFEERVKGRGLVVRGWIEQRVVLEHESVQGFLSHCGWNSVMESICAGVPILAWPMMAEQPLNARMVVEEIRIGLRVETRDGSVRGFVEGEGLSKMVRELMGGEEGNVVRSKVKELREAANKAVEEGGSSWRNVELLLNKLEAKQISESHEKDTDTYQNNGY